MVLVIIALFLLTAYYMVSSGMNKGVEVPYGYFVKQVEAGNVVLVRQYGEVLAGEWKQIPAELPEGFKGQLTTEFHTTLPMRPAEDTELLPLLKKHNVRISAERMNWTVGQQIMVWLAISGVFLLVLFFMMRRTSDPFGGGGMMGGFIRSPVKRFEKSDKSASFDDVAGLKTAKQDLQEVVEFLRNPKRFTRLGAKIPKGVLLLGPPGTGKTLLARATAGEAGVPFFSINGSEFIQMFVGVGATRVRDLFKTARENAPCIVFIDEIDAVGRVRGAGVGGGHDEREQTLNQILSEMDGFQQSDTVIVLAATNRNDVLDPALLRPGRFDRHVTVDRPARDGRLGILKVHTRKVPLSSDVDLEAMAKATIGYSGAELEKLVNEAAIKAAREEKRTVEMEDFLFAHDLIVMGAPRDEVMDDEQKRLTAFHEAGHAILGWFQDGVDPVHKVSIIPRGRALGVTLFAPEKEFHNVGEKALRARLIMMMGGRAAEKLIVDEYSVGAQNDIERATQLARKMVASWGMSDEIGPVSFKQSEEHPFLGKEMHSYREFSEETARLIDIEVQRIMHEANATAMQMLTERRDQLDALAEALLERENLEVDEITAILGPAPFTQKTKDSEAEDAPDATSAPDANTDSDPAPDEAGT
ncbi:MAG: ATP-dependent zinc metalloprotease FtsH [Planctomycetaceae bacterium]|nr:ATP-dependent zinc metalloprotease FtsH [Planctomycetaceae bacterium]